MAKAQREARDAAVSNIKNGQNGEAFQNPQYTAEEMEHLVTQGSQTAMRRPIVETPMPSIANSSKDPTGPVYVDPAVPQPYRRPLAVHETVEGDLMARGLPYTQAHDAATQAEKAAVEQAGIDWKKYTDWFSQNAPAIEGQKIDPTTWSNLNLHVDPYEAIGHHADKIGPTGDEPSHVTAPVTPADQRLIDLAKQHLQELVKAKPEFQPVLDAYTSAPPSKALAQGAANVLKELAAQAPVETPKAIPLEGAMKAFFGDETGGVPLPDWVQKLTDTKNVLSPRADDPTRAYADSMGDRFQRYRNTVVGIDNDIRRLAQTTSPEMQKPSNYQAIYRSFEPGGKSVQLTPEQQAYRDALKPMYDKTTDMYEQMRARRPDLELPPPSEGYIRHVIRGTHSWEPNAEEQDPITGNAVQSLNSKASPLQDRVFHDLVSDTDGKRYLVSRNEDGDLTRWVNGHPTSIKNVQTPDNFWPGEKVKIGQGSYTIDHATAREINQHAVNEQGKPIELYENPGYAVTEAYRQIGIALERQKMLDHWLGNTNLNTAQEPRQSNETPFPPSKEFMQYAARANSTQAKSLGWKESNLPQLKGWAMAEPLREVVNDFARPGFGGEAFANLGRANMKLVKLMFLSPVFHGYNVLNTWGTARGLSWLNPVAYKNMISDIPKAIQSVSRQDHLQDRILRAGGGLEYPALLNRHSLQQAADLFGLDVKQNTPEWEKILKPLGVSPSAVVNSVYEGSAKGMWFFNDALVTHLFLENERAGMSDEANVQRIHEMFPSYQMQQRILGSRGVAQMLYDPRLSLFGRYRGGILRSYANIWRGVTSGNAQQTSKALGYVMGAGFTQAVLFNLILNPIAQWATGDKNANVGYHGLMTIPGAALDALTGKAGDQTYTKAIQDLLSPAPIPRTALDLWQNRNWVGKSIVQPQDLAAAKPGGESVADRLKGLGAAGVQLGEHVGEGLISPMGTAESIGARKGTNPLADLRNYLLGIRQPSPATNRYMAQKPSYDQRDERERIRHPQGLIEQGYNQVMGR